MIEKPLIYLLYKQTELKKPMLSNGVFSYFGIFHFFNANIIVKTKIGIVLYFSLTTCLSN